MIHTIRTVAVGDQESKIDSPIILYRGDREVEVEFTINGSKFTFTNGGNVIKSTNATHGQLVINTPTGENMFSEVTECHNGKVVFVITKEMIDELIEVGFYSFQIRLFDESQISRVTIPPVLKGIDIRNPIAAEDETNVVDIGLVDYAVVVKDEFEDLSTFLPDGNYNKTEWESKDVISGAKLNKIEDALYNINSNMEATDLGLLNRISITEKNIHSDIYEFQAAFTKNMNENIDRLEQNDNDIVKDIIEIDTELNRLKEDLGSSEVYVDSFDGDDDLEKIKNALSSLSDTNTGTLKLSNRIYHLCDVKLPNGVNLVGSGSTIINAIGNGAVISSTGNNTISSLEIHDCGYKITGIAAGVIGGSNAVRCDNMLIYNIRIHITNSKSSGIRVGYGENNRVFNNTIIKSTQEDISTIEGAGIYVYSDAPYFCKNVFLYGNFISGFYFGIAAWGTGSRLNIQINENIIENCTNIGINMYHSGLSKVSNNNIYNCNAGIFADTIGYENNRGRGTVVTGNTISKCSDFGIYCEELRSGVVCDNSIQECGIGVYAGASVCYTLFANNTISSNTTGMLFSNEHVPTQMMGYDNRSNQIKSNTITLNREHGIVLKGFRGLWSISENMISSNNLSNGDFYAIYMARDVIEEVSRDRGCENIIINNNVFSNDMLDNIAGYQNGVYNSAGTSGFIVFTNNHMQDYKDGYVLFLNGFNRYSVIKDNIFIADNPNCSIPTCRKLNNIGLDV